MALSNREWKEFKIRDVFKASINAKPYHMKNLKEAKNKDNVIPYITRTNNNNGFQCVVEKQNNLSINPKNSICFGAENATYFYQSYNYITGNKMYYYKNNTISNMALFFITTPLNKSILNCGFSYGMGLTGKRSDTRKLLLPINKSGNPDYQFMENYTKKIVNTKKQEYIDYAKDKIKDIQYKQIDKLENKEWKEFFIRDLFDVYTGGDLIITKVKKGAIPVVSHSMTNNGVAIYTDKIPKKRIFNSQESISLADRGNFCAYIQLTDFYIGTRVKALVAKFDNSNKKILSFICQSINKQAIKFSYGNNATNNTEAIKILLPANKSGNPDYKYMEQYIKNIMLKKYNDYLEYSGKSV